jgi:hypothetical protein
MICCILSVSYYFILFPLWSVIFYQNYVSVDISVIVLDPNLYLQLFLDLVTQMSYSVPIY